MWDELVSDFGRKSSAFDGEQAPCAWYVFEFVLAPV